MRSLNLDHLTTLAAIAECGSFSAAARQLNLTQPAVSLQVRELEQRYGVRLIDRLGKKVFPTDAGRQLLVHQARIAAEVDAALATLRRLRDGGLGRLRFATGSATLAYRLLPQLKHLRQTHPTLELACSTGFADETVQAVRDNKTDLALVTLPIDGTGLVVRPALSDPLVLVLPRSDKALARSLPARPRAADIATLPFLVESQKSGASRLIEAWFQRHSVRLKTAMELGSVEAVRNAIAAGLGVSILPIEVTLGHAGEDFVTRTLNPPLTRQLALVYRPEKAEDPALKVLCAAIEALGDLVVPS